MSLTYVSTTLVIRVVSEHNTYRRFELKKEVSHDARFLSGRLTGAFEKGTFSEIDICS